MVDDFTATVIGAGIAGGIGLITVYIQQRWQRQQSVNEAILGPIYNFLLSVEQAEPGRYAVAGENPWTKLETYDRMKVPKKIRNALSVATASLKEYETSLTDYSNFAWQVARPAALPAFTEVLKPYLDSGDRFPFRRLGIPWDGSREGGTILDTVYMSIIRKPADPQAAWREVERSEVGDTWFNRKLVTFLRKEDEMHSKLSAAITSRPESQRATELLRTADGKQANAIRDAYAARRLVQRRLKLRD